MLPIYSEQSQKGQLKTCRQTYLVCEVNKKDKTLKKKIIAHIWTIIRTLLFCFLQCLYFFCRNHKTKPTFKLGKRSKRIKTRRDRIQQHEYPTWMSSWIKTEDELFNRVKYEHKMRYVYSSHCPQWNTFLQTKSPPKAG